MADISHYWGGDIAVSPSGDLALADISLTGLQRVYRRLMTNPQLLDIAGNVIATGDNLAHQTYGAGVGRKVGSPQSLQATKALIVGQMLQESAVAPSPAPNVTLTPLYNGLSAAIQYTDANTAKQQFLQFDITK
jgi:hypothetical protein